MPLSNVTQIVNVTQTVRGCNVIIEYSSELGYNWLFLMVFWSYFEAFYFLQSNIAHPPPLELAHPLN